MGIKGPRSCFSLGADPIRFRAISNNIFQHSTMVAVFWVYRPMEVHPTHPKIVIISGYCKAHCKPPLWRHPHFGIAQNTMNTHIHTTHIPSCLGAAQRQRLERDRWGRVAGRRLLSERHSQESRVSSSLTAFWASTVWLCRGHWANFWIRHDRGRQAKGSELNSKHKGLKGVFLQDITGVCLQTHGGVKTPWEAMLSAEVELEDCSP